MCVQIFAIVDEIRYEQLAAIHMTLVALRPIDRITGQSTGSSFLVGYIWAIHLAVIVYGFSFHDLENVPHFIVLRYHYEEAIRRNWKTSDRIEAILDGKWWTGTIGRKEPSDDDFPDSNWFSLAITWDTGDDDQMSPWDVQPLTAGRKAGQLTLYNHSIVHT